MADDKKQLKEMQVILDVVHKLDLTEAKKKLREEILKKYNIGDKQKLGFMVAFSDRDSEPDKLEYEIFAIASNYNGTFDETPECYFTLKPTI